MVLTLRLNSVPVEKLGDPMIEKLPPTTSDDEPANTTVVIGPRCMLIVTAEADKMPDSVAVPMLPDEDAVPLTMEIEPATTTLVPDTDSKLMELDVAVTDKAPSEASPLTEMLSIGE